LRRHAIKQGRQLQRFRNSTHATANLVLSDPSHLEREADILRDRHVRIEPIVLEHHGHIPLYRRQMIDALTVHQNIARGCVLKARNHVEGGSLAAARRTEESNELCLTDGEIDIGANGKLAERLEEFSQFDCGHAPVIPWSFRRQSRE
jgi:hypothetical protein